MLKQYLIVLVFWLQYVCCGGDQRGPLHVARVLLLRSRHAHHGCTAGGCELTVRWKLSVRAHQLTLWGSPTWQYICLEGKGITVHTAWAVGDWGKKSEIVRLCYNVIQFLFVSSFQAVQHMKHWSPCGCRDLSIRLGSRIGPHRHRVVVEVHWHGAQGWRSISWVVATFNHVGGSFNLLMAATGDVWIIPSFRIWGYVLHVEHILCVITNCGQHQWAIPSLFSIAL